MKRIFEVVYYLVVAAVAYWITTTEGPKDVPAELQQIFAVSISAVIVIGCIMIERVLSVKEQ